MKKPIQNIFAQHSNRSIAYLCGKCGQEVDKEAAICPFCGAGLGDIRCPFCNFRGSVADFRLDTCPRCGRKKDTQVKQQSKNKKIQPSMTHFSINHRIFWILFIILLGAIFFILYIFFNYF
jgi:hypothetical protein